MESQQVPKLIQWIDIAGRRKALIASCFLTAITIALGVYLSKPKVYQSDSLLSYQQQTVNTGRMVPDDESQLKDIVSTLTQIVTSRTSLEKIIIDENLYEKQREQLPMEDILGIMRRKISVLPSRDGDTFRIVYMGSDPDKVARVANSLAARFIEENMKYREARASETSAYTHEELELAKKMLDSKEAIMRDFKLRSYNEMPDQRETNMARLIALQDQNQSRQESIQNLERTRALLRDQIAMRKELLETRQSTLTSTVNNSPVVLSPQEQLDQLQSELQSLELKYKEKHPRVIYLKKSIANLEQSILEGAEGEQSTPKKDDSRIEQTDITLVELELQIKDINFGIEKITQEKEETEKLIKQYDEWISAAPVKEAEWSALTREHGELKRHYDFLVGQNLQAGSALNLERKQRGSQFKIEDSAQRPMKPVEPDFTKIMKFALLFGCGASLMGALLLEKLDTSFRFPEELEAAFPLEVLCSVPRLPLKSEINRQRLWTTLGTAAFLTWGGAIVAALGILWTQGKIII